MLAFWKDGAFALDLEDEIIKGCMVTHGGEVRAGKGAPQPAGKGTAA